ncbi:anthrone oxygenase family protein [Deinococcus roseus]|uniref:Membrane protein n=1 Tax=Deinococcus roseus TaxID=392414 RepID=A0ABQ2D1R3_9DEIO|nr:anthrone oxygenase family protein [Deinococcus roseus]GGJ36148.1 membrane protein [Deinococcus roseus]
MNWGPVLVALAVSIAAVGGVFLAFSAVVMPALAHLPAVEAVKAMQQINLTVLRSVFLGLLMGTAFIALLLVFFCWKVPLVLGSAVLYLLGMFLVTVLLNVPLNEQLATLKAGSADLPTQWQHYLLNWNRWNHVRTVASLVSSLGFFMGARSLA